MKEKAKNSGNIQVNKTSSVRTVAGETKVEFQFLFFSLFKFPTLNHIRQIQSCLLKSADKSCIAFAAYCKYYWVVVLDVVI